VKFLSSDKDLQYFKNLNNYKKFCQTLLDKKLKLTNVEDNLEIVFNRHEKDILNLFTIEDSDAKFTVETVRDMKINDDFLLKESFNITLQDLKSAIDPRIQICFDKFYVLAVQQRLKKESESESLNKIIGADDEDDDTKEAEPKKEEKSKEEDHKGQEGGEENNELLADQEKIDGNPEEEEKKAYKYQSIRDQILLLHLYRLFKVIIKGPNRQVLSRIIKILEFRLGMTAEKSNSPFNLNGLGGIINGFTEMFGITGMEDKLKGKDLNKLFEGVMKSENTAEVFSDVFKTMQTSMQDGDIMGGFKSLLDKDFIPPEMREKVQGLIPAELAEKPKALKHPHIIPTVEAVRSQPNVISAVNVLIKEIKTGMPEIVPSGVNLDSDLTIDNLMTVVQSIRSAKADEDAINSCNNMLSNDKMWNYKR
jgi:hypothetical protein